MYRVQTKRSGRFYLIASNLIQFRKTPGIFSKPSCREYIQPLNTQISRLPENCQINLLIHFVRWHYIIAHLGLALYDICTYLCTYSLIQYANKIHLSADGKIIVFIPFFILRFRRFPFSTHKCDYQIKDIKILIIIFIITIITVLFIFKRRKIIFCDTLKRIVNPLSGTFTSSSYVKWSYLHPSDIIDRVLLPCHQPLRKLNIHSLPKKFHSH